MGALHINTTVYIASIKGTDVQTNAAMVRRGSLLIPACRGKTDKLSLQNVQRLAFH